MLESADQIIGKLQVGSIIHKVLLSETDAEVIDPKGYSFVKITQAGAAETRTLANGEQGQELWILCTVFAANVVVTPSALVGTTITFDTDEDHWHGIFIDGEWHNLHTAATVA